MEFLHSPLPPVRGIDLILVRLPFVAPFATSSNTWLCKEALLLRVESDGVDGWGECVADPDPYYSPETTVSAGYIIKNYLLPLLRDGMTFYELAGKLNLVRGNRMARATVENALLDAAARLAGMPLYQFLGGARKKIPSGISIGLQENTDALLSAVAEAADTGYHRIKVKVKRGKELEIIRTIRKHYPELQLMADANGDYQPADAPLLQELDQYHLMMIEQPLGYDDVYRHAALQRKLRTPLCLDESIHSRDDAATAIELGSCRVLNIKQGRVGGMAEAAAMAMLAKANGLDAWSGGMDETGIGRAFNIHLQTLPGFTLPGDTSETKRYFTEDIADPPVVLENDGFIRIPEGAGTGITVDPKRLEKYTIARERLL